MLLDNPTLVHLSGILAMLGSLLYAVSDVLLLGYEVGPREAVPGVTEADFVPFTSSPSAAGTFANFASLPAARLAWGGLLGVLVTPLVMAGLWAVYIGLRPAGPWLALVPTLFIAHALILAPFVHGSFIYIEQNAQVLARLSPEARPALGPTFKLQQKILIVSYAVIAVSALIGFVLFSIVVATADTLFPRWMAAVNPLTTVLAWMLLKRILPHQITKYTEGAGINIGFFLFFALVTVVLW